MGWEKKKTKTLTIPPRPLKTSGQAKERRQQQSKTIHTCKKSAGSLHPESRGIDATETETPASERESSPEVAGFSHSRSTALCPASSPSMHSTTRLLLEYLGARAGEAPGGRLTEAKHTTDSAVQLTVQHVKLTTLQYNAIR